MPRACRVSCVRTRGAANTRVLILPWRRSGVDANASLPLFTMPHVLHPHPPQSTRSAAAPATTALFASLGDNTSLTSFSLQDCRRIPHGAVRALAVALRRNGTLRELRLAQTELGSADVLADEHAVESLEGARLLLSAAGDGPQLRSLCALDSLDCGGSLRVGDDGAVARMVLRDGLRGAARRLRELKLGTCELGNAGARAGVRSPLACICGANSSFLLFYSNSACGTSRPRRPCRPSGAKAIADGLRDPVCRLEVLELEWNGITDTGGAFCR